MWHNNQLKIRRQQNTCLGDVYSFLYVVRMSFFFKYQGEEETWDFKMVFEDYFIGGWKKNIENKIYRFWILSLRLNWKLCTNPNLLKTSYLLNGNYL